MKQLIWLALLLSVSAQARDELHLYNWNNYISDETVARFEQRCKCKVVQDYYSDNEEMLAKLAAGATGYDLIVPGGDAVETLIRSHHLRPLDQSKLPNLGTINPAYPNQPFDPGNRYSVPCAYAATLIGYNTEKGSRAGPAHRTWVVIFDPKYLAKVKCPVTVLDSQRELMAAALKSLGYSAHDTDEAHWQEAKRLILGTKSYWAAFNASGHI